MFFVIIRGLETSLRQPLLRQSSKRLYSFSCFPSYSLFDLLTLIYWFYCLYSTVDNNSTIDSTMASKDEYVFSRDFLDDTRCVSIYLLTTTISHLRDEADKRRT